MHFLNKLFIIATHNILLLILSTSQIRGEFLTTECGKLDWNPTENNGFTKDNELFPWRATIYKGRAGNFRCFGTLITEKLVISVASCFVTDATQGNQVVLDFIVGVGKYHMYLNDSRDKYSQASSIEQIHVPSDYRGYKARFSSDIAVLQLKDSMKFSPKVYPVCIDWNNDIQFRPGLKGYFQGMVHTIYEQTKKDILENIETEYISREECLDSISDDFTAFVTLDKMCAGYVNKPLVASCHLLSGEGLVFQDVTTKKFYIQGVGSIGARDGTLCNSQIAAYTKVQYYINFITEIRVKVARADA